MEPISEKLDEVGGLDSAGDEDWKHAAFHWMQEATNRIQQLQHEVARLSAEK